nr:hypothetical protein Iba_chr04aCG23770 [Ipomoea batatas]
MSSHFLSAAYDSNIKTKFNPKIIINQMWKFSLEAYLAICKHATIVARHTVFHHGQPGNTEKLFLLNTHNSYSNQIFPTSHSAIGKYKSIIERWPSQTKVCALSCLKHLPYPCDTFSTSLNGLILIKTCTKYRRNYSSTVSVHCYDGSGMELRGVRGGGKGTGFNKSSNSFSLDSNLDEFASYLAIDGTDGISFDIAEHQILNSSLLFCLSSREELGDLSIEIGGR